jgi:hypothetical protein
MPNRLFKLHQKSCQPLSISVWPGHRSVVSLGLQGKQKAVAILAGGISRTPSALRLMASLRRRRGLGLLSIVEIFFR